jgi:hypothetical protein
MATSKPARTAATLGAIAIVLVAAAVVPPIAGAGSSGARPAARAVDTRPGDAFSWLDPAPPPAGWQRTTTPTSQATLSYPPGWTAIPGDKGTVTRSLRTPSGVYLGYLNATPQQGTEQLHGWAAFRIDHNQEEGDKQVREVAAGERLPFTNARGSCVIDDYLSKVANNPYREIACLVTGHHHSDVFIGAALKPDWPTLSQSIKRAASAFVQR